MYIYIYIYMLTCLLIYLVMYALCINTESVVSATKKNKGEGDI